jgi:hypothetical protein
MVRNYEHAEDYERARRRREETASLDRQQRLQITLTVGAVAMLLLGCGVGFALGRFTAPKPPAQPVSQAESTTTSAETIIESPPTETVEPAVTESDTAAVETTEDVTPPDTPKQRSPINGAIVTGSRVHLKWSKVEDESGVTYAFEIQDLQSNGTWGHAQVIRDLTSTSYSARILQVKRRWRVWAVDGAGNASDKSGWRWYKGKAAPKPKPSTNPTSSDETT